MPVSLKNILIGIFVLTAIGIVVFMLLFLHPSVGDNAKTLHVRFTDIDKVNLGTRVTFAGRPVGEVISIEEIPDARIGRTGRNGDIYVYELVLTVDSSVDVFNTDEILLRTSGLLGERNIEINPRPLKSGETLVPVDNRIIYAVQTASVEDTLKQFGLLSKKFELVLDDFHTIMMQIKEKDLIGSLSHSVQNIEEITDSLNQPVKIQEIIETIDKSVHNFQTLTARAQESWVKVDKSLDEINDAAINARRFTENANQIIAYARQGQGTIGKLFMSDELYLRLKSLFHKGETTLNDINNYGILFQHDKRWQRLHARRLRMFEKLSTSSEFMRYFTNEMDQMSDSLVRVASVLSETECNPKSLLYNSEFTKRFSGLLRKVENIEESLKYYNEQIVDQKENY